MAFVYEAKDKLLNRTVAVKVLRPEFVDDEEFLRKFKREAEAVASLSHPNIVNVYDVGDDFKDIQSYNSAGCISVAAAWGIDNEGSLRLKENNPNEIFYNVRDFLNYLAKELKK